MSLDAVLPNGCIMAWPTPVLVKRWRNDDEFAARLADIIRKEREKSPNSVGRSMSGGWHSESELLEWDYDEVRTLKERVEASFHEMLQTFTQGRKVEGDLLMKGWANISGVGNFHHPHNHADYMVSGVYYVAIGDRDADRPDNGVITFIDPRTASKAGDVPGAPFGRDMSLDPKVGMMILFPSWLEHYVCPFFGKGDRISIAFNVTMSEWRYADPPVKRPAGAQKPPKGAPFAMNQTPRKPVWTPPGGRR